MRRSSHDLQVFSLSALDLFASSMGPAVAQIKSSLAGTVAVLKEVAPRVRVGFVAYKAYRYENEYERICHPLTDTDDRGLQALRDFTDALSEQGGGEEIMLEAAETAMAMD